MDISHVIKFSLIKKKIIAIVITSNYELSNEFMIINFDTCYYSANFGNINLIDTFDQKSYVIRIIVSPSDNIESLKNKFDFVKENYNIANADKPIPIIYFKTSISIKLLNNINTIFKNVIVTSEAILKNNK